MRGRNSQGLLPFGSITGGLWSASGSRGIQLWGNYKVTQSLGGRRNGNWKILWNLSKKLLHRGSSFSAPFFLKLKLKADFRACPRPQGRLNDKMRPGIYGLSTLLCFCNVLILIRPSHTLMCTGVTGGLVEM